MKYMNFLFSLTFCLLISTIHFSAHAEGGSVRETVCDDAIIEFASAAVVVPEVKSALEQAVNGIQPLPPNYGDFKGVNPWSSDPAEFLVQFAEFFSEWCEWLPEISGSHDNGLYYIQKFAMFYYKNPAAVNFVQGRDPRNPLFVLPELSDFLRKFSDSRGSFMNTSASTEYIKQWIDDPRVEISDYTQTDPEDYTSWNDFFIRELRRKDPSDPSSDIVARPVTMSDYPERDYIVVAPTDCIMNPLEQAIVFGSALGVTHREYVDNPIDLNTVIDVKNYPISISNLLGGLSSSFKSEFIGGTGLACVLLPNTYHHFHSPVNGEVIYARVVKKGAWGYQDFPNWAAQDGNAGRPGTDFTQFEEFQRAVIVIRVKHKNYNGEELTGYVASVPVGLNTIASVILDDYIQDASFENPVAVKAGNSRFGHFLYGGSLNLLLFSKGLVQTGAIQTRLGNQIGLFDTSNSAPQP